MYDIVWYKPPLLHLSWPLLHPSCTSPDPCCASLPCTSPAEVRRLSGRHFKPFQNKCEAMQSFYVLLYKAIRCGYVLGLHGTSPDLSCTSPDLSCTSPDLSCTPPAPLLTPAAPLFPAPLQQKLEGFPKDTSNHFKTNAKLCKAFLCFYIELSDVITCWACMAPLLTSPAPLLTSCTSPDPCCTFLCCTSPAEVRRRSFWHQIILWEDYGILRNSEFIIVHPYGVYAGSLQLS